MGTRAACCALEDREPVISGAGDESGGRRVPRDPRVVAADRLVEHGARPASVISQDEHGPERTTMDADSGTAALREELQTVEEELAQLRETAASLRRRIGERADDPTDPEERAQMITAAEEQEAFIEVLENRREDLLRRLGERS
jgi:hypothetical protein